jgi:hypothetical protein
MTVLAAEAAPLAAEAAPAAAGSGGGAAAAGAGGIAVPGAPGGGQDQPDRNHGVLLAVAIVLLWLAGVAFFVALEGLQVEQGGTTGGGILQSVMKTLISKAEQQTKKEQEQGG